jgi:hypothetical protein
MSFRRRTGFLGFDLVSRIVSRAYCIWSLKGSNPYLSLPWPGEVVPIVARRGGVSDVDVRNVRQLAAVASTDSLRHGREQSGWDDS